MVWLLGLLDGNYYHNWLITGKVPGLLDVKSIDINNKT